MKKTKIFLFLLGMYFFSNINIFSQAVVNTNREQIQKKAEKKKQTAYFQFAMDASPLLSLGYITPKILGLTRLDINLAIPTGKLLSPYIARFSVFGYIPLYTKNNWKIYNTSGTRFFTQSSFSFSGASLFLETRFQGGYFSKKFHASMILGIRPMITYYVAHSDAVKRWNPQVKDGWYSAYWQGFYLIGFDTSYSITKYLEITLQFIYTIPMETTSNPMSAELLDSIISFGVNYHL